MQIPDEEGIVIDGFPRDVAQALSFEDQVRMYSCILSLLGLLAKIKCRMSSYILNDLLFNLKLGDFF